MNPQQDERLGLASASSWERVHYCPGSVALINSLPPEQRESKPEEAAQSGTRIHEAIYTGDDSALEMDEAEIKERLVMLEVEAFGHWLESVLGGATQTEVPKAIAEERIWVFDDKLERVTSGRLDKAHILGKHALVLDYKSGYKPTTPAQRNLQAKVYAVALWQEYGCTNVRVAIAQHRFSSMLTQADYNEEDLERAYSEILYDDWRTKQPDAPRNAGRWCDYCPARKACPELATYSLMPARALSNKPDKAEVAALVQMLTPEQLAYVERRRGTAEKFFAAVKERLKSMPAEDLAAVGFELQPGRAQMSVTDFNGLVNYLYDLKDNHLLKDEEFASLFKFTVSALEDLILPRRIADADFRRIKLTSKAAKEQLREELSQFINWEASRSEPTLKEKQNA